ncbi:MAG: S8 family serine peptidase, partial [Pseudomonadota bacterium]
QAEGVRLWARLGSVATLAITPLNYEQIDGTSMAVPHVSGVAALVWSYFPACNGSQIRAALRKSALDISGAGRSDRTGYGLVQARAAYDSILKAPCGRQR